VISKLDAVVNYYQKSDKELARRYLEHRYPSLTKEYFEAALRHRYDLYPHIPEVANFNAFNDQDVLEVGVGQGSDHLMFAQSGARTTGIDLTRKHCEITQRCLELFGYQSRVLVADARTLPFASNAFDHVYSCGVLLLFREIEAALNEIHRVLRPGGSTTVMLYNRRSIHFWIKSRLYYGWALNEDRLIGANAVTDWYTDGIGYPRTFHYSPSDIPRLFAAFRNVEFRTTCLTPEQIPEIGLPDSPRARRWLEERFGFFLWIRAWK